MQSIVPGSGRPAAVARERVGLGQQAGTGLPSALASRPGGRRHGLGCYAGLQIARSFLPGGLAGWIIWPKPEPLAALEHTVDVPGRIASDGSVVRALDEDAARAQLRGAGFAVQRGAPRAARVRAGADHGGQRLCPPKQPHLLAVVAIAVCWGAFAPPRMRPGETSTAHAGAGIL